MMPMPTQFWNKEKTKTSYSVLNGLAGKLDFVLIGGWAVYLHTHQQESLDVDIALGFDELDFFRKYGIQDYGGINIKYSIVDDVHVDLFISEFSDRDLPVPVSEILKNFVKIDRMKVVKREMLLLLKLWGYFRNDEVKLRKDIVDVISLLFYGNVNLKEFEAIVKAHKISRRRSIDVLLEYLDKGEYLTEYTGLGKSEYQKQKAYWKSEITKAFS